MRIFLDDSPHRCYIGRTLLDCTIFHTARSCIRELEKCNQDKIYVDALFLDHDLMGQEYQDSNSADCGMEVVRWLENNNMKSMIGVIVVHSHNSGAAKIMLDKLVKLEYNVLRIPFNSLKRVVNG